MSFARRLLRWHAKHGRHDLPWQHPRSAYRVWIAEVMLQQTTVRAVIPYYESFMLRFPDVRQLASAPADEVLAAWAGLGYYARARNLHRAAGIVVEKYGGDFPETINEVLELPGIGRSTAGAILAQAFGQRHPILDGNAKRLYARHAGVEGWPGGSAVQRLLWEVSDQYTPGSQLVDYTQAVMDVGATLCTRRNPRCGDCPVATDCVARANGSQHQIPAPAPRRERPRRSTRMLVCVDPKGSILLERRPDSGIWGGLFSLPETEEKEDVRLVCNNRLGLKTDSVEDLEPLEHAFTHFDLKIYPCLVRSSVSVAMDDSAQAWYNPRQIADLGLPRPVQKILAGLKQ